jgi:hypothetical protein
MTGSSAGRSGSTGLQILGPIVVGAALAAHWSAGTVFLG